MRRVKRIGHHCMGDGFLLGGSLLLIGSFVCVVVVCSPAFVMAWDRASNHLPSINLGHLVEGGGVYVGEMALVFNSGSLLAQQLGHEIDRHQYVLRFNFAWPRDNLTQYVGTRTTHVLFGPQETNKDMLFNHSLSQPPHIDPITNSPTRLILAFARSTMREDVYFATRLGDSRWNPHNQSVLILPEGSRKEPCRKTFHLHSQNCTLEPDGICTCSTGALVMHHFLTQYPGLFDSIHKLSIFGFHQDCNYRYHWWAPQFNAGYQCNNTAYTRPEGSGYKNAIHDMTHEHKVIEQLARKGRITIVS